MASKPKVKPGVKPSAAGRSSKQTRHGVRTAAQARSTAERPGAAAPQPDAASSKLASGLVNQAQARRLASRTDRDMQVGLSDLDQAADLDGISEEIAALSEAAHALSLEEVERGMELAAMAGQVGTVGDVVRNSGMDSLATFLNEMSRRMRDLAARDMLQAQQTRGVAQAIGDAGANVGSIGEDEAAAGVAELRGAQTAADESELAASIADDQIAEGLRGSTEQA